MIQRPIKCVRDFLTLRLSPGSSLLLALSGGGDSLALLYLLFECRRYLDFDLHVAHVDHAWREESSEEAQILEKLMKHHKLPFHQKRLPLCSGSNLEDRYREMRYEFFGQLQETHGFQALLLAHHADDQGETILKRICEGARLGALGGLKPETKRKNLILWRPLLPLCKRELNVYLDQNRITPFDDWTNRDTTYLRPRMRLKIFPELENQFGKKIGSNFNRLGHLFQSVAAYLDEKRQQLSSHLVSGPFGQYLENPSSFHPLEMRFFLEEEARSAKAHLSQDSCDLLLELIENKATKALIDAKPLTFVLNQDYLFILKGAFPIYDRVKWKVNKEASDWKDFWKGEVPFFPKNVEITEMNALEPLIKKKVKKWYAKYKVPSFFHDKAPIFTFEGRIIGECLTGKSLNI